MLVEIDKLLTNIYTRSGASLHLQVRTILRKLIDIPVHSASWLVWMTP
jgi:Ethanolamine utilization protein EutJ (predicted chaperonin)